MHITYRHIYGKHVYYILNQLIPLEFGNTDFAGLDNLNQTLGMNV